MTEIEWLDLHDNRFFFSSLETTAFPGRKCAPQDATGKWNLEAVHANTTKGPFTLRVGVSLMATFLGDKMEQV